MATVIVQRGGSFGRRRGGGARPAALHVLALGDREVARDLASAGIDGGQRRLFVDALLLVDVRQLVRELRTPGPEAAAGRRVDRARYIAFQQHAFPLRLVATVRIRYRYGGQQRHRVRVPRVRVQIV